MHYFGPIQQLWYSSRILIRIWYSSYFFTDGGFVLQHTPVGWKLPQPHLLSQILHIVSGRFYSHLHIRAWSQHVITGIYFLVGVWKRCSQESAPWKSIKNLCSYLLSCPWWINIVDLWVLTICLRIPPHLPPKECLSSCSGAIWSLLYILGHNIWKIALWNFVLSVSVEILIWFFFTYSSHSLFPSLISLLWVLW